MEDEPVVQPGQSEFVPLLRSDVAIHIKKQTDAAQRQNHPPVFPIEASQPDPEEDEKVAPRGELR